MLSVSYEFLLSEQSTNRRGQKPFPPVPRVSSKFQWICRTAVEDVVTGGIP